MQFTLSPLRGPGDEPVGLVIALDDLTPAAAGMDQGDADADAIIGQSPKMQEVFDLIPLMARTEASVLITGETGTGKDRIAEAIHRRSGRADKPFIKINCGALPKPLQVKLQSVLDDQEFFPLGGEKKVQVDVRIIAATHRPLKRSGWRPGCSARTCSTGSTCSTCTCRAPCSRPPPRR